MTVTIEEAKTHLKDLVALAAGGELVVITANGQPAAQLGPVAPAKPTPQIGRCRGMLIINAEDDEHLTDFAEYMP